MNRPVERNLLEADTEAGLQDLVLVIQQRGIRSLALPALGCGNGGLGWKAARSLILKAMVPLEHMRMLLFPPR